MGQNGVPARTVPVLARERVRAAGHVDLALSSARFPL